MRKIQILFSIVILTSMLYCNAQVGHGGTPISFSNSTFSQSVPFKTLPNVDVQKLMNEDNLNVGKDAPYRFGKDIEVYYNLYNSGLWETLENGDKLWRLGIKSENALSLNFICNQFFIPQGANLFIYSEDKSTLLGSFTYENNNSYHSFATTIIPSSSIILEYYEPKSVEDQGRININKVIHGYRDILGKKGPFGTSGSCNINVNCPLGDAWQNDKRGVAIIVTSSNSAVCTGTIVNNTALDGKPYFLTANHCTASANPANWVFIFNHEAVSCSGTTGPVDQSINGASLVATDSPSDFALLLLNAEIPPEYNVYYCGWNNADVPADTTVCIHHPSGDVKKISQNTNIAISSSYSTSYTNTHWQVNNWESGTTEGGSSGSALFDQNHYIVGQLHGGQASCTNISWDKYGKIAYSWLNNGATEPNKRLKDWLDPNNTGAITLQGRYYNTPEYSLDLALNAVISPTPSNNCLSSLNPQIKIRNNGEAIITSAKIYYEIDSYMQSYDWSGSLAFGNSEIVNLPGIELTPGSHTFRTFVTNPNNSTDLNSNNDTISFPFTSQIGKQGNLSVLTDNNPTQTTWVIKKEDGTVVLTNPALESTTTYNQDLCLENGCYDFVIYDSGNNGLNGMFGFIYVGSYTLTLGNQTIKQSAEGANFGAKDSTHFCFNDVSVENYKDKNLVLIYPNPATDVLNIRFIDNIPTNSTIEIFDFTGRTIFKNQILRNQNTQINVSNYTSGLYHILIKTGDSIIRKQFIKVK